VAPPAKTTWTTRPRFSPDPSAFSPRSLAKAAAAFRCVRPPVSLQTERKGPPRGIRAIAHLMMTKGQRHRESSSSNSPTTKETLSLARRQERARCHWRCISQKGRIAYAVARALDGVAHFEAPHAARHAHCARPPPRSTRRSLRSSRARRSRASPDPLAVGSPAGRHAPPRGRPRW
jgi:hypothetical protein